jgi:hypothetical protein
MGFKQFIRRQILGASKFRLLEEIEGGSILSRLEDIESHVKLLMQLQAVDSHDRPNINPLYVKLRDVDNLARNIKFFGYDLAHKLAETLPARTGSQPVHVGLKSKPSTQSDLESDWAAYWCSQLKVPLIFHRKLWELAYVLQAIYERGLIRNGVRGLGFGCGQEPLASYFASLDIAVTVTDLPPAAAQTSGWAATSQHLATRDHAFKSHLVSREIFNRNVALRYVDMNAIPTDLSGYDFCWSICAVEHIGSIRKGLDFIENSLSTLRPGGISVHTTEFNFSNDKETIDNWPTVLFQRRHFEELCHRLRSKGHEVAELDFDVGGKPLDRFVDIPPFTHEWPEQLRARWGGKAPHIKLSVDGFPSTCFGLVVQKGQMTGDSGSAE